MNLKIVASLDDIRDPRLRMLIRAKISSDRLHEQDILIRNLSRRGMGAASKGLPPTTDERVSVLLPNGQNVKGIVRWVDGLSFGLALERDIDPQALAESIKRQTEVAGGSVGWEISRVYRVARPVAPGPSEFRRV